MASFGERLRKEREQRGITLDDIALTTKIGTRLLRALEEEKFDQLPGGIFNKGFIRAYARHVGIDEEQAIADYMSAAGGSGPSVTADAQAAAKPPERLPEPVPGPRIQLVREGRRRDAVREIPWGLLAAALLLIALAFASWSYYHREQRVNQNLGETPPQGDAKQNAGKRVETPRQVDSASAENARPSATGPPVPYPIVPVPAPGSEALSAAQAVQRAAALTPASAGEPGTFTVVLRGNDDSEQCWASMVVDGKPPVEATFVAPAQKVLEARREVVVKAGSVGALDFFFNGKRLPVQGEYGKVKTLTFHPDGLQPPPPRPSAATR